MRSIERWLLSRRAEQISKLGGSEYYYKGLKIEGFPSYFTQGGIRQRSPIMTSITDSWEEAEDQARIHEHATERECIAVINRQGVQGNLIESHYTGYRGDYFVPWKAIERLYISDAMLLKIKEEYDRVETPKISWNEFIARVTVIKPNPLSFRTEFVRFLRRANKEFRKHTKADLS